MRRGQSIILTAGLAVVIFGSAVYANRGAIRDWLRPKPAVPMAQSLTAIATSSGENSAAGTDVSDQEAALDKPAPRPAEEINLAIPFAAQAPFGDWTPTYNEACEEASLIMVDYYLRADSLSKQQMKDMIDRMVAWQVQTWGGHHDLPLLRVIELAQQFYPEYEYEIIENLTAEKTRQQLRLGYPVIVPAAGRELGNPNFRRLGPLYHMLVIKGFTRDGKFITNDPGTRNGADYVYTESVLINAIHDWTGTKPEGNKVGLVIKK